MQSRMFYFSAENREEFQTKKGLGLYYYNCNNQQLKVTVYAREEYAKIETYIDRHRDDII